ncbi:GNAT family N-acetyltransferase [Paenibacillus sp. HJGM_3]|uniref:GNAT family N-acetyltransferase n=1 Tax=Paenibacillus sp. HJGM_3 TaxID=3379816 RepID=UPI00385893B6
MASDKKSAARILRTVLAANMACVEDDFLSDRVIVCEAELREGRFRFPIRKQSLGVATMGRGAVVTCSAERLDWAREQLGGLTCGELFSAQTIARLEEYVTPDRQFMAGPDQKYVCSSDDLKPVHIPQGVTLTTYYGGEITERLYEHTEFPHALAFRLDALRPDRIAVVAECDGTLVGIAGASEDCELMWQIGVDVKPDYQGKGIGKAIVGTLTRAVLEAGVTPYYSTALSNLQSGQLAISLGYWPAWLELYARDR